MQGNDSNDFDGFKPGRSAEAEIKAKGKLIVSTHDLETDEKTTTVVMNTVLLGGREAVLRQLMNSYTGGYFSQIVVGNGGATLDGGTYVAETVQTSRTALFGTEVDRVPCVSSLSATSGGNPYLWVSSILGADSSANGQWIHEVGLMLGSGTLYAMVTWPGVYKTSTLLLNMGWIVYFR